jgi:uncharacterized protein YjiS (DUF1127 family)
MFLPVDPTTGEPAEISFEAFAAAWKAGREWMAQRRAERLAKRLRRLSDAELHDIGFSRLNAGV